MTSAADFGLVQDTLASVEVIRNFDPSNLAETSAEIAKTGRLLFTGEGSSRLFPAKSIITQSRRANWPLITHTEAGWQAAEYGLQDWAVLGLSNSGKTKEVIRLFQQLQADGHSQLYSVTAHANSRLESLANRGCVLNCGDEHAVAATKSVIEQTLVCWAIAYQAAGQLEAFTAALPTLADAFEAALTAEVDASIVKSFAGARIVYWAGRNNGVGEELTLKTNEITRKDADFLEGTYAVHGIEEVMTADDVVVWIDPYEESIEPFQKALVEGVGVTLIGISSRDLPFPSIRVPDAGDFAPFVHMAAGWNLLIQAGLSLGVDLDHPQRARKVGNEYQE